MSLGRLVVAGVRLEGRSRTEVARRYGVSRRWVHELIRRFDAEGEAGLEPRSRRPKRIPQRTSREIEDEIVLIRKQLSEQGLDAGAHTIAFHLERRHGRAPAPSTIWRILRDRGFITPQPQKRPKSSFTRFEADQPNERWQADATHWQLADGSPVEILNIEDDHSRLLVRSDAYRTIKGGDVVGSFNQGFDLHGVPSSVLTDNAAVFTGAPRGGGRCAIEIALDALGVRSSHSTPNHPQTCGKVERLHQTEKKWLHAQEPAQTLEELQDQLDRFRSYYNIERPNRALGRRTPQEAFEARPKAGPLSRGFTVPSHFRARRDRVDKIGRVTLRYDSRLHHIGLGRRHCGKRVLILVADLEVRVITEDGDLLRSLTLDPTRDYQPLG